MKDSTAGATNMKKTIYKKGNQKMIKYNNGLPKFHDFNYKTLTGTNKIYFQCIPFNKEKTVLFDKITCELKVEKFTGLKV